MSGTQALSAMTTSSGGSAPVSTTTFTKRCASLNCFAAARSPLVTKMTVLQQDVGCQGWFRTAAG